MVDILQEIHAWLRYPVLVLLVWSLLNAWQGVIKDKEYSGSSGILYSGTHILLLVQVFIGIVLYVLHEYYWTLGKGWEGRGGFFSDTHLVGMVLGMVVISFGFIYSLKTENDKKVFKRIAVSYTTGTILIFFHIPWPFLHPWTTWF